MNKSVLRTVGMVAAIGIMALVLWLGLNVIENQTIGNESIEKIGENVISDEEKTDVTPTPYFLAYLDEITKREEEKENATPTEGKEEQKDLTDTTLNVVASLEDKITDNSIWCGTLNLIWNDLKNEIAKKDIVFDKDPDNITVKNLNKGTFTTKELSESSYYKVFDIASLALKEKIEKAIKEKFNETSDILDDFDWNNVGPEDYFLYVMLRKKFEFENVFTELEKGKFKDVDNVEFFGIDGNTNEKVRKQVYVLYYNSKDDFAVKLITKQNDQVIIAKGTTADSFMDIYKEVENKQKQYTGSNDFEKKDTFKMPNINVDLKKEFTELEEKDFYFADGSSYKIKKALQTIKLKLNKEGGEIKSEAGMMVQKNAVVLTQQEPREFNVDDTFTMFLIEENSNLPYFAMKISNIKEVQK